MVCDCTLCICHGVLWSTHWWSTYPKLNRIKDWHCRLLMQSRWNHQHTDRFNTVDCSLFGDSNRAHDLRAVCSQDSYCQYDQKGRELALCNSRYLFSPSNNLDIDQFFVSESFRSDYNCGWNHRACCDRHFECSAGKIHMGDRGALSWISAQLPWLPDKL